MTRDPLPHDLSARRVVEHVVVREPLQDGSSCLGIIRLAGLPPPRRQENFYILNRREKLIWLPNTSQDPVRTLIVGKV